MFSLLASCNIFSSCFIFCNDMIRQAFIYLFVLFSLIHPMWLRRDSWIYCLLSVINFKIHFWYYFFKLLLLMFCILFLLFLVFQLCIGYTFSFVPQFLNVRLLFFLFTFKFGMVYWPIFKHANYFHCCASPTDKSIKWSFLLQVFWVSIISLLIF